MEEGKILVPRPRATALLWEHFFKNCSDKGEPSNVEEDIWEVCSQKAPVRSANTTNVKLRLHTHHPQQPAQLFLDVKKVI